MLYPADVVKHGVDGEENHESEECEDTDGRSEAASIAVSVVATRVLFPSLARYAAEHDDGEQLWTSKIFSYAGNIV